MNQPLDPFAQKFDAINVTQSGARDAFEQVLAVAAPTAAARELAEPGFYLLDDADGRFIVDRSMGVVSLADEALLERERDAEHDVRLKVVEQSGESYELDMRLRVTGLVPQMVGADDFGFAAPVAPELKPAARIAIVEAPRPQVAWSRFTATSNAGAPPSLSTCGAAPYGALICTQMPAANLSAAALVLDETLPPPSGHGARWSL